MGTRNALVTVFLLLVAGAGLAWFFSRGSEEGGTRGSGAVSAGSRDTAATPSTSADLRESDSLAALEGDETAALSSREEARVDPALLAGPAASDDAEPTPQVQGRVIDRFGQPIVGATVLAANQGGYPLDYVSDGPLPPFVNRVVATTDAMGEYEFTGIAPPSLRMLVRAPGYVPHEADSVALSEDAVTLPDVVLEPGGVLVGLVVDPFGRGVANAELFLEETSGFRFRGFFGGGLTPRPSAVSDEDGRFRIDEMELGAWRVRVETEDHPEKSFEGITERAGQPVNKTFELELGESVAGRVVDVPETEKGDLVVHATRPREGGFFGFGGSRQGKVAADGSFVVKGLRADSDYELQVRLREASTGRFRGFGARTRSERVETRSGMSGVEIPYKPEAAVTFQVVDADTGEPIEDFAVESGFRWREPLLGDDMRQLRTHPDGRVRIGNLRPDDSPASLGIEITAVGYAPWEREDVQIISAQESDLGVVRLEPLPMVLVTVVDRATGAPIEGARVSIEEQREEGGFGRGGRFERRLTMSIDDESGEPVMVGDAGVSAVTDADGLARLNSLEGKTAKVSVRREGYAPAVVEGLVLPEGRPVDQTVELGKGGTVIVSVVDEAGGPVSGVRIEHREPGRERGFRMPSFGPAGRSELLTDSDGELRFEHLAEGEHRFGIRRSGGGSFMGGNVVIAMDGAEPQDDGFESVTVGEGTEDVVTLVRATQGSLEGRVTEVGAELAGANVRLSKSSGGGDFAFGGFGGMGGADAERTDSSGRYRLDDVEPGEYTLTITHPKRRMPAEFPITIEPGENQKDVELPLSILQGRVVDEDGKPLAGVEVTARKSGGGAPQIMRAAFVTIDGPDGSGGGEITIGDELGESVHTDVDGTYELRGVAPDVPLAVHATGKGLQPGTSREVTVAPNEVVKGVDVRLEAAGSVRIEVLAADGTPANFAMIEARYLDDVPEDTTSEGAEDKREFAQGGKTTIAGMRPGRWSVSVREMGPGGDGAAPEPQEVEIEFGVEPSLTFHLL